MNSQIIKCVECDKYSKNKTDICDFCWKKTHGDWDECYKCGEGGLMGSVCYCYWCFLCNSRICKGHSWIECNICEYTEVYEGKGEWKCKGLLCANKK
jgi:hypothetical protein